MTTERNPFAFPEMEGSDLQQITLNYGLAPHCQNGTVTAARVLADASPHQ